MMLSKLESGKDSDAGNSNNAQLLRDIEEISRALYLHKTPTEDLRPPSQVRSQSAGKTRLLESKSSSNPKLPRDDLLLYRDKKSALSWNWKKPLKALTHIGNRKFSCCFYLYVHSIDGLPMNFDGFNLCVNWKRKDEVLRTHPSRVCQGMVEINETLMHRCSVYGSKSGAHHSAKYDAKLSLISVSVIGMAGLDIGKHWVDLTRLLPLTMQELEGEKNSGKWMTSFKLKGKADGASLNVSFGYSVMADYFMKMSDSMNVSKHINFGLNGSKTVENSVGFLSGNDGMLPQDGSLRNNLNVTSVLSLQSIDPGLELSTSINFLYQKLGEENLLSSARSNSEDVKPLKLKPDMESDLSEENNGYECDNIDFTIIERGIEIPEQEELQSNQATVQTIDGSVIETINMDEVIKDDDISIEEEETNCNSKDEVCGDYLNEVVVADHKYEDNSLSTRDSTVEETKLDLHHPWNSKSAELEPPPTLSEFLEKENMMEVKSSYQDKKILNKSSSLDDDTKTVARDFLKLLGIEHGSSRWSSEIDAESPRECLLRQFENDSLASGNFNIYFDPMEEQSDFSFSNSPWSTFGECFEDSDLSSIIQAAEEEHNRDRQLLRNRRQAKTLEDLETEALMREWGLNEEDFKSSPRNCSGGFGSPIQLAPKEPLELPPLGVGLGPFVWTKGGGFLRSMSPSLFRDAKNGGSLIMQVSSPVVLPAAMGFDIMEILQHLASVGTEKMSLLTNQLMPLVDLTGKIIEELVGNATSSTVVPGRCALLQHESVFWLDAYGGGEEVKECPSGWICQSWSSDLTGGLDHVSLRELVPLAMDRVEALLIDGLRIQTNISDEEVPSSINSAFSRFHRSEGSAALQRLDVRGSGSDVKRLMDLSLTLDNWLRLDAGIIGDEDEDNEQILEILTAHHAKCTDFVDEWITRDKKWDIGSGLKHGLLGNNLIIALMLQLRDPHRNHEPVGLPMLTLLQVDRIFVPSIQRVDNMVIGSSNNKEDPRHVLEGFGDMNAVEKIEVKEGSNSQFKIAEVHLAGVSSGPGKCQFWGTSTQQQSGSRWLLANGIAKSNKQPLSKSKEIVISSPLVRSARQSGDILWSISSGVHCMRSKSTNSPIRNPNVIFPDETTRSRHLQHETSNYSS
ncbi:hypothetical protein I3843_15G029700 [Carya illinoinensis]|nr:hypothetical protein I3843_15G029700 [Carya illinoinensis]